MALKYFDEYVGTAIDEINKFGNNQLSYVPSNKPNMGRAFKIIKQSSILKSDADHVFVVFDAVSDTVTCDFVCPSNPKANKNKTMNGSDFSANPLIEFLDEVYSNE